MMKLFKIILPMLLISVYTWAQETPKVEPPFWWTGMKVTELQLIVHAEGVAYTAPRIVYPGVQLTGVSKTGNPDYLFLDLRIGEDAEPGKFRIDFDRDEDIRYTYEYELKERENHSAERSGFGPEDVILLAMPDRFSNGDPANDDMPGMLEKADRNNRDGRHGGDLKGVSDHLDYIAEMGFTAIWLNPVLENNNPNYSYHGYAITDFYKVDPRFGTNADYVQFIGDCHDLGIRVIMDMVFNHCGHGHWWVESLPSEDWVHQWPEFTRSNFRAPVNSDPHAAEFDKIKMHSGWFDTNMPDLNQENEFLANYLIQNSIWWVEFAGLDGIRMDTYPYSDQAFMARWMKRMKLEYPNFNIVGEAWLQKEAITAYYSGSESERFGYNSHLPSVTDFPLHYSVDKAFHESESWTEGMARLYYVLSQDFLYDNPYYNVIFPDNHDMSRYYTVMGEDLNKYKMGLVFFYTTRGIPMVYYGTEILMCGEEHRGHGHIREDFPGGWEGDDVNAFSGAGLNENQLEAQQFVKQLQNWRRNASVAHDGKLIHFIPEAGVYVYFRINENETLMVVMNNNYQSVNMPALDRFDECIKGRRQAFEVIGQLNIADISAISIPPKSALILELK
ncbi:MAG: glycoside hydrolase family 13 protein [Bacteroidetes bacterium]|nr:glycoside hydrolase family 13 protein [Bacteroidota bacterium]